MRNIIPRSLVASVLLLAGVSAAHAGANRLVQVTHVPFSEWLSAQGGTLVAFQGRTSSKPNAPLGNLGVIDYAGVRAAANHLSYGFSACGSVTLTEYANGDGEVLVNLDFSNAINWAFDASNVQIFGFSPGQLAATPTDTPALASGHLQVKYTVPDASNPVYDLAAVAFFGGGTIEQLKLNSVGMGPLRAGFGVPEGTPGQCNEENVGLFNTSGGGATADAYPCEKVEVKATGGGALSVTKPVGPLGNQPTGTAGSAVHGSWGAIKALYR
jgi:hypothetical protein